MQRVSALLLLILSLLYVGMLGLANNAVLAQTTEPPIAPSGPHIAVLLPLQSSSVGRQSDALRLGILEAARVHQGSKLPLIIRATKDDPAEILQAYRDAIASGAQLVIGPLTRTAVTALANSPLISVPTLALSAPDDDTLSLPDLFIFGLQIDHEAKQVARLARERGHRNALIVSAESAFSSRIAQAFSDEFVRRGGAVKEQLQAATDQPGLLKLREAVANAGGDAVFLALDAAQAKIIRSYLGGALSIYATSLVHKSDQALANFDLNGVYFVDMPWLLTPDHPAVLSYNHPEQPSLELQRFYALGIDAYRLGQSLLAPGADAPEVDGVTGYITLGRDHRYVREPLAAQFNQGEARVLNSAPRSER